MKKIKIILLILLTAISVSACQSVQSRAKTQDNWKRIERQKRIVVGLDDSFVPMGFVEKNGTIDLIWNGYSITSQRKKKVAFSEPYLRNRQVLVVKKKSGIKTFAQMKGKTLGMQTGSTAEQWYESKQKVIHAQSTVLYDQIPNSFLDLNAGRIQGILLDEVYANYYLAHLKDRDSYRVIENKDVPRDLFAVGMRKGDKTLRRKINSALKALQKNGELEKLNEKWFGKDSNYLGK